MAAALQIMQTYLRGKYCTQEVHGRGEEVCTVYTVQALLGGVQYA